MSIINNDILPVFLEEASSSIVVLQRYLGSLDAEEDRGALEPAFRAAHTVKGAAGLVNMPRISALCLGLEHVLESLLVNNESPTPVEIKALHKSFQQLQLQIDLTFANATRVEGSLLTSEQLTEIVDDQKELIRPEIVGCQFQFDDQIYHIPMTDLVEISQLPEVIHLPVAPVWIRGLTILRGSVIPVIDLSALADHPAQYIDPEWFVVVAGQGREMVTFLSETMPFLSTDKKGQGIDISEFIEKYKVRQA